jgi:hypothetical protein
MANLFLAPYMKQVKPNNPVVWCLCVNIIVLFGVVVFRSHIPPQIPLFYGLPQGEEQLAQQIFLIMPPVTALLFTLLNLILITTTKDDFLKKVLWGTTIGVTLLATITVYKIVALVGSF